MFSNKIYILGLTILMSIIGVLVTFSRKYYLEKIGISAITLIDTLLTSGAIIMLVFLVNKNSKIYTDIKKLTALDWMICVITSIGMGISILLMRNLLLHNNLGYVIALGCVIRVVIAAIISYIFYKQSSIRSLFGLFLVLTGMYILQ